jgi:hypothetical protein
MPVYRTIEETTGRRVRRTVQTPAGLVIAAQGQIVSEAVIEQARVHHQEQAVLEAVKLSPDEAIHSKVGELWWRTSERLRGETAQVVGGAGKVWERVKDTVSDLTKRSTGQQGERRAANGYPGSPSNVVNRPLCE